MARSHTIRSINILCTNRKITMKALPYEQWYNNYHNSKRDSVDMFEGTYSEKYKRMRDVLSLYLRPFTPELMMKLFDEIVDFGRDDAESIEVRRYNKINSNMDVCFYENHEMRFHARTPGDEIIHTVSYYMPRTVGDFIKFCQYVGVNRNAEFGLEWKDSIVKEYKL